MANTHQEPPEAGRYDDPRLVVDDTPKDVHVHPECMGLNGRFMLHLSQFGNCLRIERVADITRLIKDLQAARERIIEAGGI